MTIYSDYLRRKSHDALKFGYSEGYPNTIPTNSKGKDLKNYEINGNSIQRNKNLLTYPYIDTTKTSGGITYTDNFDGTITVNGTTNDSSGFSFISYNLTNPYWLEPGTYTYSGCPDGGSTPVNGRFTYYLQLCTIDSEGKTTIQGADIGSGRTFTLTKRESLQSVNFYMSTYAGTFENLIIKPQLELGSTVTNYQSQVPQFNNPINIESVGDLSSNMMPYSLSISNESSLNGIIINEKNGIIHVNGVADSPTSISLTDGVKFTLAPGKYWLSGCPTNGNNSTFYLYANILKYSSDHESYTLVQSFTDTGSGVQLDLTTLDYNGIVIGIGIKNGVTVNNLIFKPMLQIHDDGVLDYEPAGYRIPIRIHGKNLFNVNQDIKFVSSDLQTVIVEDNTLIITNKSGQTKGWWVNIPVPAGGYKLSLSSTTNNVYLNWFSEPQTVWDFMKFSTGATVVGSTTQPPVASRTITASANSGYLLLFGLLEVGSGESPATTRVSNIQIEKNDIATEYEPYVTPIIKYIYLEEPLRGLRSGQTDIINFRTKKVIRNIGSKVLNGTEDWIFHQAGTLGLNYDLVSVELSDFIFSHNFEPFVSTGEFKSDYYNRDYQRIFTSWSRNTSELLYKEDGITVEEMRQLLGGQNTILIGQLKVPSEESVDLPVLPSFRKLTTIYEIDTKVLPSNMKTKYIRI